MLYNLLISEGMNVLRTAISVTCIVVMFLAAAAAILLVLLQPGNSTGINALGGSSETFFGKNKGKSIEERMKKWTIICLVVLLVFSVIFFVVPYNTAIWG